MRWSDWPSLIDGDPNIPEDLGLKGEIEKRRLELTPKEPSLEFQMLASCVAECTSGNDLRGFLNKHGDAVALLDGEESREFERIYDERTEALKLVDTASV
jgi:hypothetical protein